MPNYMRPRVPAATIFFTVALAQRGGDLLLREVDRLRGVVAQVRQHRPFQINAFVVLPDHIHAIWTLPAGDRDYALHWGAIKAQFSMGLATGPLRASHIVRREKAIWQRRFWEHHIRDQADLAAHIQYWWGNPVKHSLVKRAVDWPYSSIHADIRAGRVEPEWSGEPPETGFGEQV